MLGQHLVDLARRDLGPTSVDQLLQAAGDEEIAVSVEVALVAGPEPARDERPSIGLRIVVVAAHDARSAHDDFTRRVGRHPGARFIDDLKLERLRQTHRAELPDTGGQRIRGDQRRGLRHPVALDHGRAKRRLQSADERGRARHRSRSDEAQCGAGDDVGVFAGRAHHRLVDRGHGRVPRRAARGHRLVEGACREAWQACDAAARHQAPRERPQPVRMEQRGHAETAIRRRQGERGSGRVRVPAEMIVGDRHPLGPRRGAARVEQHRDVFGSDAPIGPPPRTWLTLEREAAGRFAGERHEVEHGEPEGLRRCTCLAALTRRKDDGRGPEPVERENEIARGKVGIERRGDRVRRHRNHRRRQLGAVGNDQRDPVPVADAKPTERSPRLVSVARQRTIRERRAAGGQDGRRAGSALGPRGQEIGHAPVRRVTVHRAPSWPPAGRRSRSPR